MLDYGADLMMKQGTGKENGDKNPCVQYFTPKHQISVWMLLEKDSDVTVLNTLMGFFSLIKGGKHEGNVANSRYLEERSQKGADPSVSSNTQLFTI